MTASPGLQLQARGFLQLHGVDGSPGMLEQAQARRLYQHLSLCTLGQEPLPNPEGTAPPAPTPPDLPTHLPPKEESSLLLLNLHPPY